MKIANQLAPIALEDSRSGDKLRLGHFWENRTSILIFLSHFG
jgi:hypothetical protein